MRGSLKKLRERYILERFRQNAGLEFQILDDSREAPDFIVLFEGREIGVEITELFVPTDPGEMKPQARTSIAKRIADRAKRRYIELGGKPVYVSIHFTPGGSFSDLRRDATAEQLAQFVLAQNLSLNEYRRWHQSYPYRELPRQISALLMLGLPRWSMASWTVAEAGWVTPLTEEMLQAQVDEKTGKLAKYRRAAPEAWLVMATIGNSAAQLFEVVPGFKPDIIRSQFDRTYYIDCFEGKVFRLGNE
jgi:hypothetical protein